MARLRRDSATRSYQSSFASGHRGRDDVAAGACAAHEIDLRLRDPARPADQLGVLASRHDSEVDAIGRTAKVVPAKRGSGALSTPPDALVLCPNQIAGLPYHITRFKRAMTLISHRSTDGAVVTSCPAFAEHETVRGTEPLKPERLENPERVEIRRRSAFKSGQLDRHEKFPPLARGSFPGGILEVAVVDQRHAHDGNRDQMNRAIGRLAGAADDPGGLHVVDGIAGKQRDIALLEPGASRNHAIRLPRAPGATGP